MASYSIKLHCECGEEWILATETLTDPDPKIVACPHCNAGCMALGYLEYKHPIHQGGLLGGMVPSSGPGTVVRGELAMTQDQVKRFKAAAGRN